MKFLRILNWILRIALFVLVLVLVLDNMQAIDFNFFSIYHLRLPLIALVLIFFALGALFGILFGLFRRMNTNSQVRKLEKEIDKLKAFRAEED
jgi:putative membrane protein